MWRGPSILLVTTGRVIFLLAHRYFSIVSHKRTCYTFHRVIIYPGLRNKVDESSDGKTRLFLCCCIEVFVGGNMFEKSSFDLAFQVMNMYFFTALLLVSLGGLVFACYQHGKAGIRYSLLYGLSSIGCILFLTAYSRSLFTRYGPGWFLAGWESGLILFVVEVLVLVPVFYYGNTYFGKYLERFLEGEDR